MIERIALSCVADFTLKFSKFNSQFFVRGQHFAQLNERAHYEDASFERPVCC